MLAFQWSSWYGIVAAVAGSIVTIGGAIAIAAAGAKWLGQRLRPSEPLVSFGHPSEDAIPWVFSVGGFQSDFDRQEARYQEARLSSLRVSYLIENKDTVPLREVSTGIRTRDGTSEHTFPEHVIQILGADDTSEVSGVTVPEELHGGMIDDNRALNFLYWACFERSDHRWEALYDPQARRTTYRRLRGRET
jgi:hypothetical protein